MTSWHRLGSREEVAARAPFSTRLERHSIAVFLHDGRFRAIGNTCNHKGGPLSEGRLRGEFVMCPWHAWEYSVVTGHGPEGYDEEQVPVFEVEERADGVYVATPPASPRRLLKHKPTHLLEEHPKPPGAPPRVLGISTTAMDEVNPRFSTSDALLEHAVAHARAARRPTRSSSGCASSASAPARATTRRRRTPAPGPAPSPSAIRPTSSRAVYEGLVHWADVVLIATPIRWGAASSLYFKMAERLNCIQNQITIHNRVLIKNKVAAFIITGGQDNIQAVAGGMLTFWAELGFVFPQFPFIAHSRGWDAEDMEQQRPPGAGERAAAHGRRPSSPSARSTPGACWTGTARSWRARWSGAGARPSASPRRRRCAA